jgi:hypothetical protein
MIRAYSACYDAGVGLISNIMEGRLEARERGEMQIERSKTPSQGEA